MKHLAIVLLLCSPLCADILPEAYFDAAEHDWEGYSITYNIALMAVDARQEAKSNVEAVLTSCNPASTRMDGVIQATVWADYWEPCPDLIVDGYRWQLGHMTYAVNGLPARAPIAFYTSLATDEIGIPIDSGTIEKYVPKGMWWYCIGASVDPLFHSPATADIIGKSYSDDNQLPTFTGLGAIPEPASLSVIVLGAAMMLRRRKH